MTDIEKRLHEAENEVWSCHEEKPHCCDGGCVNIGQECWKLQRGYGIPHKIILLDGACDICKRVIERMTPCENCDALGFIERKMHSTYPTRTRREPCPKCRGNRYHEKD